MCPDDLGGDHVLVEVCELCAVEVEVNVDNLEGLYFAGFGTGDRWFDLGCRRDGELPQTRLCQRHLAGEPFSLADHDILVCTTLVGCRSGALAIDAGRCRLDDSDDLGDISHCEGRVATERQPTYSNQLKTAPLRAIDS